MILQYLAAFFLFTVLVNSVFSRHVTVASSYYPPFLQVEIERTKLLDFWLLILGSRRSASDYAWIRLLQYYGSHLSDLEDSGVKVSGLKHRNEIDCGPECEAGHVDIYYGKYYDLKTRGLAVIKLDPFFKFAYLYTAGALAFNQDRYKDAMDVLNFGLKYMPNYWNLQLYLYAISYKEKMDYDGVIKILEQGINEPDCPILIKNSLALLYEQKKDFVSALRIWRIVVSEASETAYIDRAKRHINEILRHHIKQ